MVDTVRMVRWRGTRRLRIAAIALVAAAALLSACASTGYTYVKSSENKTYFKIPDNWKLYSQEQILDKAKASARERQNALDTSWRVVFDSSPKPALTHLFDTKSKHPTGMALVLQLSFSDSDTVNLSTMRNFFFDIDTATQNNTGQVITYEDVTMDGGFHGIHLVATVQDSKGKPLTFNEKAVLDQSTSKLYMFIVGCEATCYDNNHTKIENVVDSWTVRQ